MGLWSAVVRIISECSLSVWRGLPQAISIVDLPCTQLDTCGTTFENPVATSTPSTKHHDSCCRRFGNIDPPTSNRLLEQQHANIPKVGGRHLGCKRMSSARHGRCSEGTWLLHEAVVQCVHQLGSAHPMRHPAAIGARDGCTRRGTVGLQHAASKQQLKVQGWAVCRMSGA